MNIKNNFVAVATAVGLLLSVSTRAELVATAGGLGVYDTVNNVTWTSDGNLMATQVASFAGGASAYVAAVLSAAGGVIHDIPNGWDTIPLSGSYSLTTGINDVGSSNGLMTWFGAKAWVNYLNATNYAGTNTWSLPTTKMLGSSIGLVNGPSPYAPNQFSSQLAELFYDGLGASPASSLSDIHNASYALFTNLQNGQYWSDTEWSQDAYLAFELSTLMSQGLASKTNVGYALAVSPGQVGELLPLPGAAWLLGSGLLGLIGLRRSKAQR